MWKTWNLANPRMAKIAGTTTVRRAKLLAQFDADLKIRGFIVPPRDINIKDRKFFKTETLVVFDDQDRPVGLHTNAYDLLHQIDAMMIPDLPERAFLKITVSEGDFTEALKEFGKVVAAASGAFLIENPSSWFFLPYLQKLQRHEHWPVGLEQAFHKLNQEVKNLSIEVYNQDGEISILATRVKHEFQRMQNFHAVFNRVSLASQ